MRTLLALVLLAAGTAAAAEPFKSIDGGTIDIAGHDGPVLLVNTASLCAYTPQLEGLQALHEAYAPRGLLVLAVPSDDFRQELGSEAEVAAFCEAQFGLTLPMTTITHVRGAEAHPVYRDLAEQGFVPAWNFNKALIEDGRLVAGYGSGVRPGGRELTRAIEAALGG